MKKSGLIILGILLTLLLAGLLICLSLAGKKTPFHDKLVCNQTLTRIN